MAAQLDCAGPQAGVGARRIVETPLKEISLCPSRCMRMSTLYNREAGIGDAGRAERRVWTPRRYTMRVLPVPVMRWAMRKTRESGIRVCPGACMSMCRSAVQPINNHQSGLDLQSACWSREEVATRTRDSSSVHTRRAQTLTLMVSPLAILCAGTSTSTPSHQHLRCSERHPRCSTVSDSPRACARRAAASAPWTSDSSR